MRSSGVARDAECVNHFRAFESGSTPPLAQWDALGH